MKIERQCCRVAAMVLACGALTAVTTLTADAHAGKPGTATFDNGKKITANMWIQNFTWTGCGSFKSSAVMTVSPKYITDQTDFYQIGVGSLSVKGVNISSSQKDSNTLRWTNSNGSKGSYLSGSVCGGWGAVYVGANVQASAFYYGNFRVATTKV